MIRFFCCLLLPVCLWAQDTESRGGGLPLNKPLQGIPLQGGNLAQPLKPNIPEQPSNRPFFTKRAKNDWEDKGIITAEMQYLQNAQKNTKEFSGKFPAVDQDLGGFSTKSKTITIVCRDHQAPDGDTVTIYLNNEPIIISLILDNGFRRFTLPLKKGVNSLAFKALNQGSSGPNTAQFILFDENQKVISHNQWNLATGAKAFLSIARD